jgi:PEP-CTERM motif
MKSLNTCHINLVLTACTLLGLATSKSAFAATIDFESIPGAYEGMEIGNQFQTSHGVTFSLEDGSLPILAQVGGPGMAFSGGIYGSDTPAPGQHVGQFFLSTPRSKKRMPLIISYSTPVSGLYGELLDIDGPQGWEAWRIEARDNTGSLIDSVKLNSGNPGTGNGIATPWSFNHKNADIYSIRMVYTGQHTTPGLAFDNFSRTSSSPEPEKSVPEPSSALGLLVFGTFGGVLFNRKQQQKVLNSVASN